MKKLTVLEKNTKTELTFNELMGNVEYWVELIRIAEEDKKRNSPHIQYYIDCATACARKVNMTLENFGIYERDQKRLLVKAPAYQKKLRQENEMLPAFSL